MPCAYVQTAENVDLDMYDRVGAELGDDTPAGAIFHVAGLCEGKLRIMEVWESEQAYRRFRDERLLPAIEKVVGPEAVSREWPPPGQEAMDVHNLLRAD